MERKQTMEHTSLLVLSLLQGQDLYGYQMITELERRSDHTFQMKEGTLYPVLKKLENSGVIQQYTLLLDTKKIGKDISAFISVSLEHPKFNEGFIENVKQNPQVTECHYITGDFDFLLKVITGSTQELEAVLNEIKCIHGVSLTKTLVVLSTMKNEHSVLPDLSK